MPASSMEASNLPVGPLYANPTSFVAVKSSPLHPKRKVVEISLKRSLFDHFFMSMHQLPFRERASTVQMHHQIPINPQIVLEHPHPHFSFNLPKHSNLRRFPRSSFSHKSFYPPYSMNCGLFLCLVSANPRTSNSPLRTKFRYQIVTEKTTSNYCNDFHANSLICPLLSQLCLLIIQLITFPL